MPSFSPPPSHVLSSPRSVLNGSEGRHKWTRQQKSIICKQVMIMKRCKFNKFLILKIEQKLHVTLGIISTRTSRHYQLGLILLLVKSEIISFFPLLAMNNIEAYERTVYTLTILIRQSYLISK